MTFSDRKIAKFVNEHFVATWFNRGPGFHNEDYSTEKWLFQASMEAYPTKNICTFFLAPDRSVFHYVAGTFAPEVFRGELETALQIRRAAFDDRMNRKPGAVDLLREIHEKAADRLNGRTKAAGSTLAGDPNGWKQVIAFVEPRTYRGTRHVHTAGCTDALLEGYRYLQALHRDWSSQKRFPKLNDVRFRYLFGNAFTEEPARGGLPAMGRRMNP